MRHINIYFLTLLLLIVHGAYAGDRPNVILMMADDMGWGGVDFEAPIGITSSRDIITYPGTTQWSTPNLRAMAKNGLVFGRMYSQAPTCSPTRASVLTGRAPQRMGIPFANRGRLENREVTLAEYAQALGYTTGHFGKWHLGVLTRDLKDANRGGTKHSHAIYSTPLDSGFDVQFVTESKTSTYDPGTSGLTRPTRYWTGPGAFVPLDDPRLKGDDSAIIVREAVSFIRQAVAEQEPFLAVVWFHTPHKPLNTPGNTDVDNLKAYKFAMQDMDTAIGELRQALRELGVAENTMVCFTSDNGPEDDQDYNTDPLRANKRELYEGGVRVPGLIEWPARVKPGTTLTPMVTTDYLPTLLDIWGIEPVDDRPMDGQSMKAVLLDDHQAERVSPIFFQSTRGWQSVIGGPAGRYKLISNDGGKYWELFDIHLDFKEKTPITTSRGLADATPEARADFNTLNNAFADWRRSVEHSLSDQITGDYETRISRAEGLTQHREPPASLQRGASKDAMPQLFLERQHTTLHQAIASDETSIAEGRVVHSYLIHYDPTEQGHGMDASITFDDEIVAVLPTSALLKASDALSFGDPAFENGAGRGLETIDQWAIEADGKTLRLMLQGAPNDIDQLRILTRSSLDRVK